MSLFLCQLSLNPLSWLSLPGVPVSLPTEASPLLTAAEQFALDEMYDCFICTVTPILIFNGDALEAKARWSASLPFRAEVAACPVIEHARCSWKLSRSHPVWKWAVLPAGCCSCFVFKTFNFFCINPLYTLLTLQIYSQARCVIFEFWTGLLSWLWRAVFGYGWCCLVWRVDMHVTVLPPAAVPLINSADTLNRFHSQLWLWMWAL